jgi:putative oxidoreductase
MNKRNLAIEIISSLFILLFTYTAITKLLVLSTFEYTLSKSPLLEWAAGPLSVGIPVIELIIAVLLLVPRTRLTGLYVFTGLMVLFTLWITYLLTIASHRPCSCGGILKYLSWKEHLFFNLGVVCLGIVAINLERKRRRQQHAPELPPVVFT